ncbi:STAS domain-containing protein [Streptomyces sp. DT193]|uniref:STAS domain-containing protein n=1 Tax=Streptomyces sp. DT193 TaxID=3393418 RepID=UPI003CE89A96
MEPAGALDHRSTPDTRRPLPGLVLSPGRQLVIDLGRLTFCDSTGITFLIAARNHAPATDASAVPAAVPDGVSRTFRMTGPEQVFAIHPTARAAAAAWTRPPPVS